MVKIFLICYLILITRIIIQGGYFYLTETLPKFNFVLFAQPLNYISLDIYKFIPTMYVCFVLIMLLCIYFYKYKVSHFISAIVFLLFLSIMYSTGKINHSNHAWALIAIGACFLSPKKLLSETKNLLTLRVLQALILSHYTLSGIWKLRSILRSKQIDFSAMSLNHFSTNLAAGSLDKNYIFDFVIQNPSLLIFGYFATLIFQISCIIPIILKKYYMLFAIGCCLFHLSTEVVIGVRFTNTAIAALFLLFFAEILVKTEINLKSKVL